MFEKYNVKCTMYCKHNTYDIFVNNGKYMVVLFKNI